jgi:hypothetical protein
MNVTVPVAVNEPTDPGVTVAVKVTFWPCVPGFGIPTTVTLVAALFTVWPSAVDVLPAKVESPLYVAVIECAPAARAEVMKVAWPELSMPDPMLTLPSKNTTEPVGVPVPDVGATVAVNVTACPKLEGLSELITVVVVAVPLVVVTISLRAGEVLPPKLGSPP